MKVSHQDFADSPYAFRGKRSKRLRPSSPVCQPGTMVTTSSSTAGDSNDDGGDGEGNFYYSSSIQNSPTTSTTQISTSSTSEEDEDMANCLILLAQSGGCRKVQVVTSEVKKENISSRKFTEMVSTTTGSKAGFYVYECKTCNRTFPSFQALGGHRASHKRPKTVVLEEKKHVTSTTTVTAASLANNNNEDHDQENDQEEGQVKKLSPSLSVKIVNNNKGMNNSHDNCNNTSKSKIHECAICGSEFSSGQALGGHMRRHRPPPTTTTAAQITKISTTIRLINETGSDVSESSQKNNFLSLDLNLPAPPEDDHVRDTKFDFSANKQSLVFSTAALVDCHY